jgi:hypothetical protein
LCRRTDYSSYRDAVDGGLSGDHKSCAGDLNRFLARERLNRGHGISRAEDRKVWSSPMATIPDGTVVLAGEGTPNLVWVGQLFEFTFGGWINPRPRPKSGVATVLTPPLSVLALTHGFSPVIHPSATT